VAEHIAGIADDTRRRDAQTLVSLLREVTQHEPVLWGPGIIAFGKYRYTYDSGHSGESGRLAFAARKTETVLYLVSGFEPFADLLPKLGKHKTGKGCLYFKRLDDVDPEVLRTLLTRAWQWMAQKYPHEA
jgi:hypothetical protein